MKRTLVLVILTLQTSILLFAQIKNYQSASQRENQPDSYYTGEKNFLGQDVYNYIGQDLCFVGASYGNSRVPILYEDPQGNTFTSHYRENSKQFETYRDYNKSPREEVKYFHVVDVIKHPKADEDNSTSRTIFKHTYFLKLKDKEDNEIYYFRYDTRFPQDFPFITFVYFATQKQKIVGTAIDDVNINSEYLYDIISEKNLVKKKNRIWKCTDLVIEVNNYELVVIYEHGKNKIMVPYEYVIRKFDLNKSTDLNTQIDISTIDKINTIYPVIKALDEATNRDLYNPSYNFLGENPYPYIGQDIFIIPTYKILQKDGYSGFYEKKGSSKNKLSLGKTYSPSQHSALSFNTYESLAEKYFKIVNVFPHPNQTKQSDVQQDRFKYYLELEEFETKEHLYYEYDGKEERYSFPFITLAHYDYLKNLYVGKQIILGKYNWYSRYYDGAGLYDLHTGKEISNELNKIWNCLDINFVDNGFCFILQNQTRETIAISYTSMVDNHGRLKKFYTSDELKHYKTKFSTDWDKMYEYQIDFGFTEQMVEIVKGAPDVIKKSIDNNVHKWEYISPKLIVYFENGLTVGFEEEPKKK